MKNEIAFFCKLKLIIQKKRLRGVVKLVRMTDRLDMAEVPIAARYMERHLDRTPVILYDIVRMDGLEIELYGKMDTLNPGGSFKHRGAEYFMYKHMESGDLRSGDTVVTASAGNHAKGVAAAARAYNRNLRAKIFMSTTTPRMKIDGTRELGADVELFGGNYSETAEEALEFARRHNFVYVPAYEHQDIILGQSTIATEVFAQTESSYDPDFFIVPFGGGGLGNGIGLAADYRDKKVQGEGWKNKTKTWVFGVQAENFNTATRSYRAGRVVPYEPMGDTVADGIRVPKASPEMLELSQMYIDDMFDVTEGQIRQAIRNVYHSSLITQYQQLPSHELTSYHRFHSNHIPRVGRMNIVEGAAAAAFACAAAEDKIHAIARHIHPRKKIVGVVVASGNNIDQSLLDEILQEQA